jgi:signal transduction histidine kinase
MQDRLFDIATQLDLGLSSVADEAERLRIAELNLRAGRKAKAASAYELAARYLAVSQALLPSGIWERDYVLAYGVHLERARCEMLSQRLEVALELTRELQLHARSAADQLEVAALQIDVVVMQSSAPGALDANVRMATAACGKWLGVELPLHPSEDDVRRSVEETLRAWGDRPIEDIALLPEMTDPAVKAGVEMLSKAMPSAYNFDIQLHDLISSTIVKLSLRHGHGESSPHGYSTFGATLGRLFERWDEAYRFGRVAAEVVERRGPAPSLGRGSSYFTTAVFINGWTRPMREVIPMFRRSFEAARECGDINVASFSSLVLVEFCFSAGETLAEVAAEAERQLAFTRHVRQYIQDYVGAMLRLVRHLRGPSAPAPGTGDAAGAAPPKLQHPFLLFQYQTFRAIEHFIFGNYRSAVAEAEGYRTLAHMGSASDVALAWYIAALAYSCHYDDAPLEDRAQLRRRLADLEERHRVWERRCAATFRNRRALISAEAARIDGRDAEAFRLYEEAIAAAREDGFAHNEAIAAELASRFCRMRGLPIAADAYLRRAREGYRRWGADAKVDQLDRLHASLRPPEDQGPAATLEVRPDEIDLRSLLKASQTISGEIELGKLVRTLLESVLMQGGAQRATLVIAREGRLFVEAQAELGVGGISTSTRRQELGEGPPLLPVSLLRYVELTRERAIIDGDPAKGPVADEYLLRARPRSALCIPVLKQGRVLGLLYLENRLLAGTFTPGRLAAVEVLATQSAISVENALLLAAERDARAAAEASEHRAALLSEASARLAESLDYSEQLVWLSRFCVRGIADWCIIDIVEEGRIVRAAGAHRDPGKESVMRTLQGMYPPHPGSPDPSATVLRTGAPLLMENISDAEARRSSVDDEHARLISALGSRSAVIVPLAARGQVIGALSLVSATAGRFGRADLELAQGLARRAAVAIDNARLYQASQEAVRLRKQVEAQLVQAQKMESIGRLAGGIAHDFNNLLTVINGSLELGLFELPPEHPVRAHLADASEAASSAANLTRQLLAFSRKQAIVPRVIDLGDAIRRMEKVILRLLGGTCRLEVTVAPDLAPICFDAGQVEQIMVNLAVNARDAMAGGGRLAIRASNVRLDEEYARLHVDARKGSYALVEVSDTGTGMTEEVRARLFEPFFTTKETGKGTGLGLSVVYGAVRQNHGHIEVQSEPGRGTTFRIYLPAAAAPAVVGSQCD